MEPTDEVEAPDLEQGSWRLHRSLGSIEGILGEDGLGSERLDTLGFPLLTSRAVDDFLETA